MRRLLSTLALFVAALQTGAQTPTFHTGTQLVVVDVTVSDSHGNPVHNLKSSDFSLAENSTSQTISHFEEHTPPTAAELASQPQMPKLGPNIYTNFTIATGDTPINVLLLDYLNTPIENQPRVREQLLSYLKTMKPGTRIAIFGLNGRLVMLQSLTSDPQLLMTVLSTKGTAQRSQGLPPPIGTLSISDQTVATPQALDNMRLVEATQTADQNALRVINTLGAMNLIARYLAGMPGRKNLIWFSGSFPLNFLPDARLRNSNATVVASFNEKIHETINLMTRSQVAVYPVDVRGLRTTPLNDVSAERYVTKRNSVQGDVEMALEDVRDENNTMQQIADATGGHAFINTNGLREAAESAIQIGSNYYTLAYSPSEKKDDGSYRKIAIHLSSGNYTLTYRKGYYAETPRSQAMLKTASLGGPEKPELAANPMRPAMQRGAPEPTQVIFKALLVADPTLKNEIPKDNTASPKLKPPYRIVTVAYAANPGDIDMPQQADGNRHVALEFVTLVYDSNGQLFNQASNTIDVFAKPAAYQDFLKEGIRYQQQIAVPAKGEYYIRSGIHDLIANKVGAIEVPAATIGTAAN